MRILLLVSSFNGLTQRVWCALREAGHEISVELAVDESTMVTGVEKAKPDLVLCPFLKERVPARVWQKWRTIIIHPGPVGDRGPSSLDYAITEAAPVWGVTAIEAIEEMDAGPVWATRTFPMPATPPRKSALYNGPVADAALECVVETVDKVADPTYVPVPLALAPRAVPGTGLRPMMRQADRAFGWDDEAAAIVRRVRAADGSPGVRTQLAGTDVYAFDAHLGFAVGRPGALLAHRDGAVLVGTGSGSVWLGQLRVASEAADGRAGVKLPATTALRGHLREVPEAEVGPYPPVAFARRGSVGVLTFRCYNGALSTRQCRRLAAGLRYAMAQDIRVLVLRGGNDVFCNGIHLGVIDAAADPAAEAWSNIKAINAVCRRIVAASDKTVIATFSGSAGAGGVMMALGADVVAARSGVVLNPYYDMGLYGSELHTFTLPARVGREHSGRLLDERLPVDPAAGLALGLVDEVGPRDPVAFDAWLTELAATKAEPARWRSAIEAKSHRIRRCGRPLSYYESRELAEMARDMFDNRSGFAEARSAFVHKRRPEATPPRLAGHRQAA